MTSTLTTTTDAFLDKSGMNYTVSKEPAIQRTLDATGQPVYSEVEGQFHLVRSTDSAVISPKTVSGKYVPINPRIMIAPVAPLIAEGWVTPHRGYKLSEGSHEVLSFKIDGGMLENEGKIVGEEWDHSFQIHNFQGAGSFFGTLYCIRKICVNGATRVVSKGNGFRLRHTGPIETKYEEAMQTWKEIKEQIRKLSERMTVWNGLAVTATQAVSIFQDIYEVTDPNDISSRTKNELEFAIREFANPQRGTYGRSLYDIYNAITATNTHYAPANSRESEVKRTSSMLNPAGSRNKLEARAVEILSKLA